MQLRRRDFLALSALCLLRPGGVLAAGQGTPLYLSAATRRDGSHWVQAFDLSAEGAVQRYALALPERGHHVAVSESLGLFVAVARRPGDFLVLGDLADGRELARVPVPEGRYLMGHGVFSADGSRFYTTESLVDVGADEDDGRIGLWQISREGERVTVVREGDFSSQGTGPHELLLLPDGATLAVANGGYRSRLNDEREILNRDTMQPNLSYLALPNGRLLEQLRLEPVWHQASIRHLDVNAAGDLALALQFEGAPFEDAPLLALHQRGGALRLPSIPLEEQRRLQQYCGSVRFDASGRFLAVSSPRGNVISFWDVQEERWLRSLRSRDGCGLCAGEGGFLFTAGTGRLTWAGLAEGELRDLPWRALGDLATEGLTESGAAEEAEKLLWDNHLSVAGRA